MMSIPLRSWVAGIIMETAPRKRRRNLAEEASAVQPTPPAAKERRGAFPAERSEGGKAQERVVSPKGKAPGRPGAFAGPAGRSASVVVPVLDAVDPPGGPRLRGPGRHPGRANGRKLERAGPLGPDRRQDASPHVMRVPPRASSRDGPRPGARVRRVGREEVVRAGGRRELLSGLIVDGLDELIGHDRVPDRRGVDAVVRKDPARQVVLREVDSADVVTDRRDLVEPGE